MLLEKISVNFNKKVSYRGRNASYQTIQFYVAQNIANYFLGKDIGLRLAVPLTKIERNDQLHYEKK